MIKEGTEQDVSILAFIVRLTCVAYLIEMIIGWRGYIRAFRTFELTPVISGIAVLPPAVEWLIYLAQIIALIWLFFSPRNRVPAFVVLGLTLFCILRDLLLLVPYVYMYSYVILAGAALRFPARERLHAVQIMVCGVYFWAGFHKLNLTFYTSIFPWFIAPVYTISPSPPVPWTDVVVVLCSLFVPLFELLIGVALLVPAWKKTGALMAFIMLTVVLVCLGPWGHNWGVIVWPWNIYLFWLDVKLFFDRDAPLITFRSFSGIFPARILSIALFVVAPALAIITPWYTNPGFKLYAGSTYAAQIILSPQEQLTRMPPHLQRLLTEHSRLDVIAWAVKEIGHAPVSSPLVMERGSTGLCPYLDHPQDAILRIYEPSPFYSLIHKRIERPLCP